MQIMGDIFVFIVASLFFVASIAAFAVAFMRSRNCMAETEAIVTSYDEHWSHDTETNTDSVSYVPVFFFTTPQGGRSVGVAAPVIGGFILIVKMIVK